MPALVLGLTLTVIPAEAQETSMVFVEAPTLHATFVETPEEYDPNEHRTILVALHGFGSSAERFLGLAQTVTSAGIIFASVRAPYAFVHETGHVGWDWSLQHLPMDMPGDRATELTLDYLTEVFAALRTRYPADRLYVLGFSQGGAFAYMSAIANHTSIDGLIVFGARFSESWFPDGILTEANHLPVFIGHGETDEAISVAAGERARNALTALGYDVTFRAFPEGHQIPPRVLAEAVSWIGS